MKYIYLLLFLLLSCYTLHNPFIQTSYDNAIDQNKPMKTNFAINKIIYASSMENASYDPRMANDGNLNTRWSSNYIDNQWVTIDLEDVYYIDYIIIHWYDYYATEFRVNISTNGIVWPELYYTDSGIGGNQQINIDSLCQFIELDLILRNSAFSFSIKEIEIYL